MQPTETTLTPEPTYADLAGSIEHVLLRPELSETDISQGVDLAKRYGTAAVVVRPSDVDLAANWTGPALMLGTVADWPYGNSSTAVKTFATRDYLRRGAKSIDTVMNTGKLISRQFQYLEMELVQMAEACHQSGATLGVALETAHLNDELMIVACRICRRAGADFIAAPRLEDCALLKEYSKERLRLKASGGVDSLEQAWQFRNAGCERLQTTSTAAILEAWKAKLAELQQPSVIS